MLRAKVILGVFIAILVVASAYPTDKTYEDEHAEELEHEFQGDMIITQEELDAFNGRIDERLRWPNNVVPYWINMTFLSEYL